MALTLSMRVGQDVFVRDDRVVIAWMDTPYRFGVRLNDGPVVTVSDENWTTLFPGVKVQAGIPRNQGSHSLVKLVFDAPGVLIVRGALYRKGKPSVCGTCHGSKVLHDQGFCPDCHGAGCNNCCNGTVQTEFKCPDCDSD